MSPTAPRPSPQPSRRAPTSPGSRPLPCTARCTRSTSATEP
jgi:hypothetical protein